MLKPLMKAFPLADDKVIRDSQGLLLLLLRLLLDFLILLCCGGIRSSIRGRLGRRGGVGGCGRFGERGGFGGIGRDG